MPDYSNRLGRIETPQAQRDARRAAGYTFEKALQGIAPPAPEHLPDRKLWRAPSQELDQIGPTCTVYSIGSFLEASPMMTPEGKLPKFAPLYARARDLDEIPGTDYEGSTVHGAAMAYAEAGWIGTYLWTNSPEALRTWLYTRGTVVVGTDWYEGMMDTDRAGYLNLTGPIVGGHAYNIVGHSRKRQAYRIRQTWGDEWGEQGRAWIHERDLHELISATRGGEVLTAVQDKLIIP